MKITNENFNNFRMKDYYNFRTLREARLVNPSPTLPTSSYKRHPPFYNLKRPIEWNPGTSSFYIVYHFVMKLSWLPQLLLRTSVSVLPIPLQPTRIRRERRVLNHPDFLQVMNLIPWITIVTRYFLMMKVGVSLLSLITLRILTTFFPRGLV